MSEKPNVLVLGATGKVGGEVVKQLVAVGDSRVIAATRSPQKAQSFKDRGIDSVILDLEDNQTLIPAMQGVDRALLLTGYTTDMLRQSKRFLDAAKQVSTTSFILAHLQHPPMK